MTDKKITIDFDGVLIEKILGLDWKSQGKIRVMKNDLWFKIYRFLDLNWARINHQWRKPIAGSREGLQRVRNKGYKIIFITSRQGYLRQVTFDWLKKWGYFQYFDGFYFNDELIGSIQSKVDNIKQVNPEIHVDDNKETVEKLAKTFPKLTVYYINRHKVGIKAGKVVNVQKWDQIQI